jgi:hypothetical protein
MGILNQTRHRIRKASDVDVRGNKIYPDEFNRVVAYGCSFTAGDEIVDHLIIDKTFEETNKIKQKFSNQVEFYKHFNITFPTDLILQNSWAGQLARLLNKPFVNKAYPGFSIGQSFFQIFNDYKNNIISKNDLILVGLTGTTRMMWYNKDLKQMDSAPLLNYIENLNLSANEILPLANLYDDNLNAFYYYSFLNNIQQLKSYLNIRIQPMIVNNSINNDHFSMRHSLDENIYKYCLNVFDDCSSILLLPKEHLRNKVLDPKIVLCGYKHPPLESHIELAIKIYDKCVVN